MKTSEGFMETHMEFESLDEILAYINANVSGTMLYGGCILKPLNHREFNSEGIVRRYKELVFVIDLATESNIDMLAKIAIEKEVLQTQINALTAKESSLKSGVLTPIVKG